MRVAKLAINQGMEVSDTAGRRLHLGFRLSLLCCVQKFQDAAFALLPDSAGAPLRAIAAKLRVSCQPMAALLSLTLL